MDQRARFIDNYLPYLLMQAAYRMGAGFHAVLKHAGVRESEWRVLATLSQSSGMRISELESHVLVEQSTLSRTIGRMVQKSFVVRRPDPKDGRAQLLALTAEGQTIADALIAAAQAQEDADLAHLAADQRSLLANTLSSLFPALGFADAELDGDDAPFRMKVRLK
ncbi:MAG: MarR family winged helix-turn-helix transcriptional regulator [Hyphomicrobiales bacterium]